MSAAQARRCSCPCLHAEACCRLRWFLLALCPGPSLPCSLCLLIGFSCLADTKYMNANDNIDGAASWLMCSVGTAKRLGIPEEKWVYQHSGAHCHEGTEQVISTTAMECLLRSQPSQPA